MIISNERYLMNENESSMYAVQMTLVIRKLHKSDMGGYKCISKNSIGDAEGTIRLYVTDGVEAKLKKLTQNGKANKTLRQDRDGGIYITNNTIEGRE
uniref:I-set domain-containing protein n=1 Tax=Anopheles epiroticus TaxID=199890 RepID=A0A182PAT6_9DIPT